jgi:hypothetical protein
MGGGGGGQRSFSTATADISAQSCTDFKNGLGISKLLARRPAARRRRIRVSQAHRGGGREGRREKGKEEGKKGERRMKKGEGSRKKGEVRNEK